MKLNNVKVIDVEVDGIDMKDHPDYCDAYISEAKFENGKSLNDDQLVELQEQNYSEFYELVYDNIVSKADFLYCS